MYDNNIIKKQTIEKACRELEEIEFDYVDSKMNITHRYVKPYEFKNFKLIAYDMGKAGIRQFEFDGIQNMKLTGEHYDKTNA